jgi:lysophospholipase L1-like esterase
MKARAAAARGALALGSIVLVAVLGELSLRALDVGPRFAVVARGSVRLSDDTELAYELRPGWRGEVNAHGMRDRERRIDRVPGRLRIAALGDSVTYGLMLAPTKTWPARLESLLGSADGGPDVEVLNFGVPGYSAQQVAAQLEHRVLPFSPDLAVYAYVLNDPQATSFELEHLQRDERAIDAARPPLERMLMHSRLFLLARRAVVGRTPGSTTGTASDEGGIVDPAFAAYRRDALGGYFHRLHTGRSAARVDAAFARIARVSRTHRLPVLVAIFPVLTEGFGESYRFAEVHERVEAAAARAGLATVDLAPAFRTVGRRLGLPLARDFLHPDEVGQRVAALALRAPLARLARAHPGTLARPQAFDAPLGDPLDREIDAVLRTLPHPTAGARRVDASQPERARPGR